MKKFNILIILVLFFSACKQTNPYPQFYTWGDGCELEVFDDDTWTFSSGDPDVLLVQQQGDIFTEIKFEGVPAVRHEGAEEFKNSQLFGACGNSASELPTHLAEMFRKALREE